MCECNYTVDPCKTKQIQTESEDKGKRNEPLEQEAPVRDQDKTNEILPEEISVQISSSIVSQHDEPLLQEISIEVILPPIHSPEVKDATNEQLPKVPEQHTSLPTLPSEWKRKACLCITPEDPCKNEAPLKEFNKYEKAEKPLSFPPIKEATPPPPIEESPLLPIEQLPQSLPPIEVLTPSEEVTSPPIFPSSFKKPEECPCSSQKHPPIEAPSSLKEEIPPTLETEKIKCTCLPAESPCKTAITKKKICKADFAGLQPKEKTYDTDETTVRELKTSLAVMKKKCQIKDQIITVLAEEIQLRAKSGIFENLLSNVSADVVHLAEPPRDFDIKQLSEFFKIPNNYPTHPPPSCLDPSLAKGVITECPATSLKMKKKNYNEAIPYPTGFQVLRRVGEDSLLLQWDVPQGTNFVGYEIYVNGKLAQKIHSISRNKALLQNLDLQEKAVIALYALTSNGCTSEPFCIVYPDPEKLLAGNRITSCKSLRTSLYS